MRWPRSAWLLLLVVIFGQIAWVLVSGPNRVLLTWVTVVGFWLVTLLDAQRRFGKRWMLAYAVIIAALGWAVEAVGVTTGRPFGVYEYTDLLGPKLGPVPALVPLAWSMMVYPCWLAARRVMPNTLGAVFAAAWLIASWDLFLDPQMVGEGYWKWQQPVRSLPGIPGIPLSNYAGWLLVSLVMMLVIVALRKLAHENRPKAGLGPTGVMLGWVYASNVLAGAVFFGRPLGALIGAVAMGLVVIAYWRKTWIEITR